MMPLTLRSRFATVVLLATFCLSPAVHAQQLPFEQVVAQLKSPDAGTRLSALRLLRESGYPEAGAPIAALLSDPEARIQREALSAELALFLGAPASTKRVALVLDRRDPFAASRAFEGNWASMPVERVPIDVVTGLLTLLGDRRAGGRVEAAYAIGVLGQVEGVAPDLGYKAVVETLSDRLGDSEPAVRLAVARAAGRVFRRCPGACSPLAVERIGDALVRLLNDPETVVQGAAMEGLGELRYERAVKGLTEAFGYYKSGEMAFAALDTLARIAHASSVPQFQAALSSKDPNFRRAAVEGLARTGDKDGLALVDKLASSERDGAVTLAVAFAQQRTGRSQQAGPIITALNDRNLRPQAQDYLVELGPPAAADVAGALSSASPDARVALLEVLGVSGGSAQAPAIESWQNDRDPRVAAAAKRTLSRIRSFGR